MKRILLFVAALFSLFVTVAGTNICLSSEVTANDEIKATNENSAEEPQDPNNVVIEVEGQGETLAEAKKDALRSAVEQVVGSLVDAQTRVDNDELIEQILTASSAYVEKYKVLNSKIENGIATVKVRVTVVKTSLTKKLKLSGGGQTVSVDGASLVGKAATKAESEKNGAIFLANFLKKEEFPYSLFDVKFVGEPKIVQKDGEVIYTLEINATVNRDRYLDFVKRLKSILDQYAIEHSNFILSPKIDEENNISYEKQVIPGLKYQGNHFPFYLCTGITGNFRSLKFETYELPQKFCVPFRYYKRVSPVINVVLLDSQKEEITTKRIRFRQEEIYRGDVKGYELFNIMPTMFTSTDLREIDVVGESTILDLKYSNSVYYNGWATIAPYRREFERDNYSDVYSIFPSANGTVEIILSPEELSKVKSASVSVIVNNPAMNKAFERMADEIDKIPTE